MEAAETSLCMINVTCWHSDGRIRLSQSPCQTALGRGLCRMIRPSNLSKAAIPPGKSDASGGIGPRHIVTLTSGFSARCRPMRPILPVEFQLKIN